MQNLPQARKKQPNSYHLTVGSMEQNVITSLGEYRKHVVKEVFEALVFLFRVC